MSLFMSGTDSIASGGFGIGSSLKEGHLKKIQDLAINADKGRDFQIYL